MGVRRRREPAVILDRGPKAPVLGFYRRMRERPKPVRASAATAPSAASAIHEPLSFAAATRVVAGATAAEGVAAFAAGVHRPGVRATAPAVPRADTPRCREEGDG